jgi:hypothetical protein
MKNLFKPTVIAMVMSITLATTSQSYATNPKRAATEKLTEQQATLLINRLEEIKAMDASNMSRKEKRVLRHEVNSINKTLRTQSSGVYISVGAAIIILLLLIILL